MLARSSATATRQPVSKGDVVWALRCLGTTTPADYRFVYAFVVNREPEEVEGLKADHAASQERRQIF